MKIIFLDLEGVLITLNSSSQGGKQFPDFEYLGNLWPYIGFSSMDPKCIENLNKISDATDAKIVMSSTWRMGDEEDFQDLSKYLRACGVKADIIGRTPSLKRFKKHRVERGTEIQAWINLYRSPIKSFVILDDMADMAHLRSKLVYIKDGMDERGLEERHVEEAINILNDPHFWTDVRNRRKCK